RAPLLAFDVTQPAQGLHAADLDALEVVTDDELGERGARRGLVVPDLELDTAVQRTAGLGRVRRDGLRVAPPFVGDGLGRQIEAALQELGDLARALARETLVVAEDADERGRERLRVGMADEVQAYVALAAQAPEHGTQLGQRAVRNLRDARRKAYRRHDARQLDGLETLGRHLEHLDAVAAVRRERGRVVDPRREIQLGRQVSLRRLAARHLGELR